MNTMNEMVASMVGGIVMANGGKVEYDIPNTRKRLSIVVEDREPTLEERQEDIAKFLTNMGLEQHYPDADTPLVCLTYDEMEKLMAKVAELL
jgi:hypothetical protein